MKKLLLIILLIGSSITSYAGMSDSLYIGYGSGYSSYNTYRGELYLRFNTTVFNRNSEFKIGVNNRSYEISFDGVHGLDASSFSIFSDLAVYPFNHGLFTGLRWEMINFNWLSSDATNTFRMERNYSPTSFFTGTCLFFQLGYHFRINNYFALSFTANRDFSNTGYLQAATLSIQIMEFPKSITSLSTT